jgi:thiamine-phosphate pyrophosphorylase
MDAVRAGSSVIQYRIKDVSTAVAWAEALELQRLCENALFIVNDRIDIALATNADGAHIGNDDLPLHAARKLLGPDKIIGVTVRNLDEAVTAEAGGADYLGVGPIYGTTTKPDAGKATGLSFLREVRQSCRIPLAAIGGITLHNAEDVILAGADMLCAISASVAVDDVYQAVKAFDRLFRKHSNMEV